MFSLFGDVKSESISKCIRFRRNLQVVHGHLSGTPVKAPKALVPKIDDDIIAKLKEELDD